jgi:hypothetical protein
MADEGKGEMPEQPEGEKPEGDKQPNTAEMQAELEKVRIALKAANKEAAERRKRLTELEQAEEQRKSAEMTEAQKLQETVKKLEAEKTDAITRANARVLRAEIIAKAGDFHDPEDVYLALKEKLSVNDDGEVDGLDEALKELKKSKPHWLKGKPSPQLHGGNPGQNANGQEETREQRRARLHI